MMPPTILLVDDDPDIHLLLGTFLREAGFQISAAYDGASALTAAERTTPDLIVLDIGLPDGDGEATLVELRGRPALANVPVMVVSACPKDEWAERVRLLGANGYLEKSADPMKLVAEVEALLHGKSAVAGTEPA